MEGVTETEFLDRMRQAAEAGTQGRSRVDVTRLEGEVVHAIQSLDRRLNEQWQVIEQLASAVGAMAQRVVMVERQMAAVKANNASARGSTAA